MNAAKQTMLKGARLPGQAGRRGWLKGLLLLGVALSGCAAMWAQDVVEPVRFVIIGDFGSGSTAERKVRDMVVKWQPDVILTVGDNAYSNDTSDPFTGDVVDFYGAYIKSAKDDPLGEKTRFFPTLGNHDYLKKSTLDPKRLASYKKVFAVPAGPGGHFYYELALAPAAGGTQVITNPTGTGTGTGTTAAKGVVRFFALDSNKFKTAPGVAVGGAQELWFRERQKASKVAGEPWQIALFHHTPYTSGTEHEKETHMRTWKFEDSGISAVVTGHEHVYERVMVKEFPFITNGLGGAGRYEFDLKPVPGSVVQYAAEHGAIYGEATAESLVLEFWDIAGKRQDRWPENAAGLKKVPVK